MSEDERPAGPGGLLELPLVVLDEVIRVVPRLIDRTRSQAELARSLASHLPCIGGLLAPHPTVPVPAHEAPQPIDVLQVVALHDEPSGDAPAAAPDTTAVAGPSEASLAVPDYDSLAASQVVPRLAALNEQELAEVQAYERAHRNRQTILNKVAQLQAR